MTQNGSNGSDCRGWRATAAAQNRSEYGIVGSFVEKRADLANFSAAKMQSSDETRPDTAR
jgi:hypothetical protein